MNLHTTNSAGSDALLKKKEGNKKLDQTLNNIKTSKHKLSAKI